MNAMKGRLKVSLLVVGVLVVGFGMYVGFQPEEVEAHPWSCAWMLHKGSPYDTSTE